MRKAGSPLGKWWNAVFVLTALLVIAADQISKLWIRSYSEGQIIFEAGFLRITHIHNTGAAFGLFQNQNFPLTIIALLVLSLSCSISFLFLATSNYWIPG